MFSSYLMTFAKISAQRVKRMPESGHPCLIEKFGSVTIINDTAGTTVVDSLTSKLRAEVKSF